MKTGPTLATTLFRVPRTAGIQPIQRRREDGGSELTTHRLTLGAGQSATFSIRGEETIVVVQRGSGHFACDAHRWEVARSDVFSERATALLLPPGRTLVIGATTPLEAVLVSTPADPGGEPVLRTPADVTVQHRGKPGYERDVHD